MDTVISIQARLYNATKDPARHPHSIAKDSDFNTHTLTSSNSHEIAVAEDTSINSNVSHSVPTDEEVHKTKLGLGQT